MTNTTRGLPMIAMRGMTAFPGMLLTFDIERSASMAALNFAMGADQIIFLVTQKDILKDIPSADDVYSIGTVCRIRQQLRQPNGSSARIMVEGLYRGRILDVVSESPIFYVDVEKLSDKPDRVSEARKEALVRNSVELFEEYVHITNSVAPETVLNIFASKDPGYVSDFIANHINFRFGDKQKLLEELIPSKRLAMLNGMLVQELAVLSIEQELVEATNEQMNKAQREYFLHEDYAEGDCDCEHPERNRYGNDQGDKHTGHEVTLVHFFVAYAGGEELDEESDTICYYIERQDLEESVPEVGQNLETAVSNGQCMLITRVTVPGTFRKVEKASTVASQNFFIILSHFFKHQVYTLGNHVLDIVL